MWLFFPKAAKSNSSFSKLASFFISLFQDCFRLFHFLSGNTRLMEERDTHHSSFIIKTACEALSFPAYQSFLFFFLFFSHFSLCSISPSLSNNPLFLLEEMCIPFWGFSTCAYGLFPLRLEMVGRPFWGEREDSTVLLVYMMLLRFSVVFSENSFTT